MKDAQKPDHISLNNLIGRLREGRYVIPDFQREFEWKPWDIRELMRSIFLDYYIGSLLLWKGKKENFKALSCERIYGFKGEENPEFIVLDGQQRLTALYYAFLAPKVELPQRRNPAIYYLDVANFMNEEYDRAFHYDWLSPRFEKLLADRKIQFESHLFPLSVVGAGGWEMPNWVQGYEKFWAETALDKEKHGNQREAAQARVHAQNAEAFGAHLRGIVEQYQISYVELDRDLAIDKVCDIFTQINSRGVRLDIFDLMNALLKPKGLQLKHMWRDASERLAFTENEKMDVYILQVMSILRQGYCSPKYLYFLLPGQEKTVRDPSGVRRKETLVPDIVDFKKRWNQAVDSLESAVKMIKHPQEFGAISSSYLPYITILPVFAALQTYIKELSPEVQLNAQRKIRHWYWASIFTNRYSGAVESTSARDFLDVRNWINDDTTEPALIQEFQTRFKQLDLRKEIKRGTSVYNGIFNLFVIQGARDWITGNIPQHDDLKDHHIVPAPWGTKNLPKGAGNTILNRSPLTKYTNDRIIANKLPNAYLPDQIAKNGEQRVRAILESHFISPKAFDILLRDPFTPEDFDDFAVERQRTLLDAIESLLIKERLDLSPQLRELDAEVEIIELALRRTVTELLDHDATLLPQHVKDKIEDLIQRSAKRNPTIDTDRYTTLSGKLEYCNLRELQDIISSKSTWDRFQVLFANKEMVSIRFGQLAELRNGIRHSRTVDEITKKEGEAAIIWFKKVVPL